MLSRIEDRFFITSLAWDLLTPVQILLLVQNHWGVENDSFNSLDRQWHEDAGPWCTRGTALWALKVLRLLADNTAQILRRRRLQKKEPGRHMGRAHELAPLVQGQRKIV